MTGKPNSTAIHSSWKKTAFKWIQLELWPSSETGLNGKQKKTSVTPKLQLWLSRWLNGQRKSESDTLLQESLRSSLLNKNQTTCCTDRERWRKTTDFVLIKRDAKRATKVFSSNEEATQYLAENPNKHNDCIIRERKSAPRRCLSYCNVSQKCTQHQRFLEEEKDG
jgi:hypothetical protein